MSERPVRLRLAGEPDELVIPAREGEARGTLGRRSIAVVAAVRPAEAEAFGEQLAVAARETGAGARVLRAALRARPGIEASDGSVRASADAIGDALDALVDGDARADVARGEILVAIGAPFVALRRADLSVLLTSGATAVQWDPQIRALRDRFELLVAEPRAALARALVERVIRRDERAGR